VRSRLQALTSELGGESALSHAQISLCRRVIWIELMIEHEEARMGEGQGIDIAPHVALVGSLLGLYRTLGIKRVAREPRLSDYLKRGEP